MRRPSLNHRQSAVQGRFEDNLFIFAERETIADGLGPTYNDMGCVECHQFPDPGAFAQQMEFRAGRVSATATSSTILAVNSFTPAQPTPVSWSTYPRTKLLGLSASCSVLLATASWNVSPTRHCRNNVATQPANRRGTLTNVPVVEANNALRVGRFGWKAQHASLASFSGDAYLNEMGITNPFDGFGGRSSSAPDAGTHENPASTAGGVVNVTFPSPFDPVPDPEDDGLDVLAFADFMAATRAPGRGPITNAVRQRLRPVRSDRLRCLPHPHLQNCSPWDAD